MEENYFHTKHFIFFDDLKLISQNEENLKEMINKTTSFFEDIGLEINPEKSATNCIEGKAIVEQMETHQGYKYLGIIIDKESRTKKETLQMIKEKIFNRTKCHLKSNLNVKNIYKAINEYALSLINYYVGVVKIDIQEYTRINNEIRKIFNEHKAHLQSSSKEILYLKRDDIGRGLGYLKDKSKLMLLDLNKSLKNRSPKFLKSCAILVYVEENMTSMLLIEEYLKAKYSLETVDIKSD